MLDRTDLRWPGYIRSAALACWAAAVVMTVVLSWSAWHAYDVVADARQHLAVQREVPPLSKTDFLPARR
ncbi:hypothetical protein [Maricaulis sp.]|uniref:hypothetical protein n=1 Tax=Maricaulis sp. TaxID=1486257 RepID=UPI00260DB781|nr:hypothetical protein [Maricaulis sp.]